jgi:ferredoxin-nitrate reductase
MTVRGETICPYCGVGCRLSVEGAVGYVADRFRAIIAAHGPDAVAFYGSGQLDTETAYVACKLFKGFLGTNNTDSNSRLCMASAVAGYRSSLGADGPPGCYDDIELAGVVLIVGSNMAEAHPVLFDRLRAAKQARPGGAVVVVDPRRTATAKIADLHLPVRPGGDVALLNALGRLLLDRGAVDAAFVASHTSGFAAYRDFLLGQDVDALCEAAGLPRGLVEEAARRIGGAAGFLSFYCMGMNQSVAGTWKNNSLINLHLLTGQIGKPGAGPFSLTGQPNAMGGREAGLLAHQLPGYRFVDDAAHRAEVEAYWGRPAGSIKPRTGLTAVEMFRALERCKLKAIWIAATNPVVSLPDVHQARRALAKAELVVVSDAYHPTETTLAADVLLPAAQWGEKEWTSTNSERLVSFSPRLFAPPGSALPDWQALCRFARAMGLPGFEYDSAAEVWDEFRRLTAGRPCDMSGAAASRLRRERHLYWPCPAEDHPGSKRRYLDGVFPTPDGRARFLPRPHLPPREETDHEFPFVLTTGRLYPHWHTLTRSGKCEKLMRREPAPYLELHPDDAAALGVADGDLVQASSRRGTIRLPARVRAGAAPGVAFLPFHWGDLFAPHNAVNYLTMSALDPTSRQPELKYCAVALEKVEAARPAAGEEDPDEALAAAL